MDITNGVEYIDPNDDYDPHDNRTVQKPTNNWQTYAHFLKAGIGTGVLAMPNAFSNSGYFNGFIFTIIIGSIILYCLHILIGSMYILCKINHVPHLTYSQAMTIGFHNGPPTLSALTPIAGPLVDGFLASYHFGICCVYVVFIAESIKQIIDEYVIDLNVRIHILFLVIPLLSIYSIRNLKFLAIFTSFANGLLFFGFGVILYYIFHELPPLSERNPTEHISKLPLYFGTVLFALEAVGVILSIEENMEKPETYVKPFGVMNMGMLIIVSLYILIGFFGYWKYGNDTLGSITLNIPQDELLSQATKILFAVTIYISYPLQGYVTADIVWNKYLSKKVEDTSKHFSYELGIRAIIVLSSIACAIAVPNLSIFLSLVGSCCLSILGLIFPPTLQICLQYRSGYGPYNILLVKNILLMAFGIVGGVVGTTISIQEIIQSYSK